MTPKPKLGSQFDVSLAAFNALLRMYLGEPSFKKEFDDICQTHRAAIDNFAGWWLETHRKSVPLADSEYHALLCHLKVAIKKVDNNNLNPDPCIIALDELAWRWRLKLPKPLAGSMLFIYGVASRIESLGIPLQEGKDLKLNSILKPLKLSIKDRYIMLDGVDGVIDALRPILHKFSSELRARGVSVFPSSLNMHAEYWFKHYVQRKTYAKLEKECFVSAETIKRKVWEFRRRLSIEL